MRTNSSIKGSDCDPLTVDPATNKTYYPCGLIANSLFNDTFYSPVALNAAGSNAANQTYAMTNKGIAWNSDKDLYKPSAYTVDQVVPPLNWRAQYPEYSDDYPLPDLHNWEEFQVWMRTAGLPFFSKLALRNDTMAMASGRYQVNISDCACQESTSLFTGARMPTNNVRLDFPVNRYDGTKAILISTSTVMGGKNSFLGIAYVVVAGICVLLGALFTVTHLIRPR